jgi:hypothetical protein
MVQHRRGQTAARIALFLLKIGPRSKKSGNHAIEKIFSAVKNNQTIRFLTAASCPWRDFYPSPHPHPLKYALDFFIIFELSTKKFVLGVSKICTAH